MKRKAKKSTPSQVAMTEAQLLDTIRHAARQAGWLFYHVTLSMYGARGLPDVVMVKDGKLAFWELKSAKGKVTPEQQVWLDELAKVPGLDVRVVRPANLEAAYKFLAGIEEAT